MLCAAFLRVSSLLDLDTVVPQPVAMISENSGADVIGSLPRHEPSEPWLSFIKHNGTSSLRALGLTHRQTPVTTGHPANLDFELLPWPSFLRARTTPVKPTKEGQKSSLSAAQYVHGFKAHYQLSIL